MIKNTANQYITFGAIAVADGLPVTTGTPSVYLSKDGGAQATSSNTATHVGNGLWQLELSQSETNADHLGAVLVLANAVNAFSQAYPLTLSDFKSDATAANQTSISNAIAALNDFNPASDTVSNVTLVATCTSNSDMRGTDNANTIAPDNAGITSNGTAIASNGNGIASNGNAIAALNDITASDVFNQLISGSYVAGSFGERLLVGTNSNRECQVTGSNHIAADVHEIQTDAIDADSIAASAVTELQTDLIKVGATHTHTNQAGDTMQVTIT